MTISEFKAKYRIAVVQEVKSNVYDYGVYDKQTGDEILFKKATTTDEFTKHIEIELNIKL